VRRGWLLAAAVLVLGAVALSRQVAYVPDSEMSPSYLRGDLVLVLPLEAREGDVVALRDPLDPSRWTLRRVEGIGGAARYSPAGVHTSSRPRSRLLDMGEFDGDSIRLEGEHLVSRRAEEMTRYEHDDVGIPDDAAYLSADARDRALDSRWWGPVPLDALGGVVVFRVGAPATPWRGWTGGRAEGVIIPQSTEAAG